MALEILAAKSKVDNNDWDSITVLKHTKDVIQKALDLFTCIPEDLSAIGTKLTDRNFQKTVIKTCILHDLGKISWEFQNAIIPHIKGNWSHNKGLIKTYLINLKDVQISSRHELYSILWSLLLLKNDKHSGQIQTAILYHHYNSFYAQEIMGGLKLYEGVESQVASYLKFIECKIVDFTNQFFDPLQKQFDQKIVIDVFEEMRQSLSSIDINSIISVFENGESISEHLDLYENHLSNTENKSFTENEYEFLLILGCLRRSDYSASGNVEVERPFHDVYSNLDKQIAQTIGSDAWQFKIEFNEPKGESIAIIQAPTGSGKTELALLWAQKQRKKLFYTLPLRVALNDIYQKRLLGESGYLKDHGNHVSLLHSTAFLEYMKEKSDISIGEKVTISRMLSNALYLSTIDQVFLSSLLYYGCDKLFALYPYSCFVIDEIQSYTPEMMAVIFKTMEHMQKLGSSVLIITATLPPYVIKILQSLNLQCHHVALPTDKKLIKNHDRKRHLIDVKKEWICEYSNKQFKDNTTLLVAIIKNRKGNTLIILNNVNKAIKVFESLLHILKVDNDTNNEKESGIYLLHSRLLESEKSRRISQIKEGVEKGTKGIIVVSTQIIEASVDFDFDILHSELCPIDSLIQRMGRVHRNRNENFNGSSPNVFVYVGDKNEPDVFTSMIYSKSILKATRECLLERQNTNILDFSSTNQLLNRVFNLKDPDNNSKQVTDVFIDQIQKNLEFLKYFKASKRSEAQRIFRRLAGRSVIVINALVEEEETKLFGEYLERHFKNGSLYLETEKPWTTIFQENKFDQENNEIHYTGLKWLLNASISIPEYHFSKISARQQFKDFHLIRVDTNKYFDLKIFGYDKIKYDLEREELGEII